MRITESQLRRIIRQEVRALHEMPRRRARLAGGPFTVGVMQVPAGFYATLYVSGYGPGEVAKAFDAGSSVPGALYMAHSKKGIDWRTADEAIESLYSEVDREAMALGRKQAAEPGRVRPNEALRLELLNQAVDTWDTIPVQTI